MPEMIPFTPGDSNQKLEISLAGESSIIEARWNSEDTAWYLNVRTSDGTPVAMGLKVCLGVLLGRSCLHPFFRDRALFAIDRSNQGLEAGLNDLGSRVMVIYLTEVDLALAHQPPLMIPR